MTESPSYNPKQSNSRTWSLNRAYNASTLHEVANMLDLTLERVRQMQAKALMKIRKRLETQGVSASDLL
jgi:DNA-directed RNA polymerase sigma subunit (sigma70/sigma32)